MKKIPLLSIASLMFFFAACSENPISSQTKSDLTTATVSEQDRWTWCYKCQGLFYGPNAANSVCPDGGQHYYNSLSSINYHECVNLSPLPDGVEDDWSWCDKCQGLFYGPEADISTCPDGGHHNQNGTNYSMMINGDNGMFGSDPFQNQWKRCYKCKGLFYGPNAQSSHCPVGGQHGAGDTDYYLHWHS